MWVWHSWQGSQGQGIWLGLLCSRVDPQWCSISVVKAVAGSWSGWCQVLLHLLWLSHICACPFPTCKGTCDWPCPAGVSVLGNLSGVVTGAGSGIIWRPAPKISGKNLPVPKKALSTMSKANVNIPVLTPQLHMEIVCSVIALGVLQLTLCSPACPPAQKLSVSAF